MHIGVYLMLKDDDAAEGKDGVTPAKRQRLGSDDDDDSSGEDDRDEDEVR